MKLPLNFKAINDLLRQPFEQLALLSRRLANVERQLDGLMCSSEMGPTGIVERFQLEKATQEYQRIFEKPRPLVTVCVGTYNRSELLVKRSVQSVLNQTYDNLQLIVVGDACTDDTAQKLGLIRDSRLYFENLKERGKYPQAPFWRWMVAGTAPFNRALQLAEGDFVTHLDDDDEYVPDRIAKLVAFAQAQKADLVWHPFFWEAYPGVWRTNDAAAFRTGEVTTSSVFYHRWLAGIPWDIEAYKTREPGDSNRFRKLRYLGIHAQRYPEPLLRHFLEQSQPGSARAR